MSNIKQNFARVPRNVDPRTAKPAQPVIRVDAKYLESWRRLEMGHDLDTVMTSTQSTLTADFGRQGVINYVLKGPSGEIQADAPDIKKIQSLNWSITKERKEAQKSEVSTEMRYTLAAFIRYSNSVGKRITEVPSNFLEVVRGVNTTVMTVNKNVSSIETIDVSDQMVELKVKRALIEYSKRIRVAVGEYLLHRLHLEDGAKPRKLNSFLIVEGVPIFIFNKLSSPSGLGVNSQSFSFRSILFPMDPSKGFYLTFKEGNQAEIIDRAMGLLDGADLLLEILASDNLIRKLINVKDTVDIRDFETENSFASKIAGTPFWIPPFPGAIDNKSFYNFLAKNGTRGVSWDSGSVLTAQDNMKFVGTLAKRMAYALLQQPRRKGRLLARMFPGFDPSIETEEDFDIYDKLRGQMDNKTIVGTSWFHASTSRSLYYTDQIRPLIRDVFADVTAVPASDDIVTEFVKVIELGQVKLPRIEGPLTTKIDHFTEVKIMSRTMRSDKIDPIEIIGNKFKGKLGAVKRTQNPRGIGVNERSVLTDSAKLAIATVKMKGYASLSIRLESWFRGFMTEKVQGIVANLFNARIDSFFNRPIELDRQEKLAFLDPTNFDIEPENQEMELETPAQDDSFGQQNLDDL